jgi:hypothetical protein
MISLNTPVALGAKRFEDLSLEMFRRFRQATQISLDVPGEVWVEDSTDDQCAVAQEH